MKKSRRDKRFKSDNSQVSRTVFDLNLAKCGVPLWIYREFPQACKLARAQLEYDIFVQYNGHNVYQLSKHYNLSKSRINIILTDQQVLDFRRKYSGGDKCQKCGAKIVVMVYKEIPIFSVCKSGHKVTVVYNKEKRCFLV